MNSRIRPQRSILETRSNYLQLIFIPLCQCCLALFCVKVAFTREIFGFLYSQAMLSSPPHYNNTRTPLGLANFQWFRVLSFIVSSLLILLADLCGFTNISILAEASLFGYIWPFAKGSLRQYRDQNYNTHNLRYSAYGALCLCSTPKAISVRPGSALVLYKLQEPRARHQEANQQQR